VRSDLWWNQIEIKPGEYVIPELYQRFIDKFDELDLNFLAILGYRSPYHDGGVTPYTEAGYKAFTDYIEAILELLPSKIDAFQVYNEYNIHFSNGPAGQDVGHYYTMLKKTYDTIKHSHPEIEIAGLATAG